MEDHNKENFEQLLYNYNQLTPFDKWFVFVLSKVKEKFKEEGIGEGGFT